MPWKRLTQDILGTELKLISTRQHRGRYLWDVEKVRSNCEICPKCASPSSARYGSCLVVVRQQSLWGASFMDQNQEAQVFLQIMP